MTYEYREVDATEVRFVRAFDSFEDAVSFGCERLNAAGYRRLSRKWYPGEERWLAEWRTNDSAWQRRAVVLYSPGA